MKCYFVHGAFGDDNLNKERFDSFNKDSSNFIQHITINNNEYLKAINKINSQMELTNKQYVLCGHSLGAYYILKYLENIKPTHLTAVVLFCPVGILPFLGEYGWYWGFLFKYGFIKLLNIIIYLFTFNFFKAIQIIKESNPLYNHISWGYNCYWKYPAYKGISVVPTCIVYGKNDNIIPPIQANFIKLHVDKVIIENANHSLYSWSPSLITDIINTFVNSQFKNTQNKININKLNIRSYWCIKNTRKNIQNLI